MLCVSSIEKSDGSRFLFHFYFTMFVNISFWRLYAGGFTLALCIAHTSFRLHPGNSKRLTQNVTLLVFFCDLFDVSI